jgi:hypothetical protein
MAPTAVVEPQYHVVADVEARYCGTDFFNHAGAFVTEDRRKRYGVHLVARDQVRVADPGGD